MKKILLTLAIITLHLASYAQDSLKTIQVAPNTTLHFISPEPIQYVDISCSALAGDLPIKNVLRIRLKDSVAGIAFRNAVVTIAGETFIAQYRIIPGVGTAQTEVNILPGDVRPLDIAGIGLSQNQLKALSMNLIVRKPDNRREKVKAYGITGQLNHIYSMGDYLFLDISYHNKTRLKYDIDDFTFSIDDKKVTKASNVQSVALKPEFVLFPVPAFEKYYRNIFVFKKLTFPGNKIFTAELSEKQISGRLIILKITYKDLLEADILLN